jgi:Reverse transcriptase (RNA-dependent DNA polymerase)
VDDYIITGGDTQGVWERKEAIKSRFKMKDLGACKTYLGIEVSRDREKRLIKLPQQEYTTKLVTESRMWESKRTATPMEAGTEIEAAKEPIRIEAFRSLIGRIGWLVVVY